MFQQFVSYFVDEKKSIDKLYLMRVKLLVGILLFLIVLFIVLKLVMSLLQTNSQFPYVIATICTITNLLIFRGTKSLILTAHLHGTVIALAFFQMTLNTGGIFSLTTHTIFIVPFFMFITAGNISGFIWSVICVAWNIYLFTLSGNPDIDYRLATQQFPPNYYLVMSNLYLLIVGFFIMFYNVSYKNLLKKFIENKEILKAEKEKSDNLLLNILPIETANELKEKGMAETREYKEVSILFSDFVGFTKVSSTLSPKEVVEELNYCFQYFDQLMDEFQLEKIKTIGDAYMCVSGLPDPNKSSAINIVMAGLKMQEFIDKRRTEREKQNLPAFGMRVGIHTGPVIAGIVGSKKFQYDIWGDTVNIASRMESNGGRDMVNISAKTYQKLKDNEKLMFHSRGVFDVKGKGKMEMYFVGEN